MTKEQVLQGCTVEGNIVKLPEGQLDRKLYLDVAKSLNLIGGKWKGGKVMGFVFSSDPSEMLAEISQGAKRNLKKEYQFFETPEDLADEVINYALLEPGHDVLEPSAGQGALIKAVNRRVPELQVDCYELMDVNQKFLEKIDTANFLGSDFFNHNGKKYDRIIANPPFTKNADIDHFMEMCKLLKPAGRLVSIVSGSWYHGSQKKQTAFKEFVLNECSGIYEIDKGRFKSSGTMVGGYILILDK